MSLRIAIALGDVTGIGPEVTLKALASLSEKERVQFGIFGDEALLRRLNVALGTRLKWSTSAGGAGGPGLRVINPLGSSLPERLSAGDPAAAKAALEWVTAGGMACLRGEWDALVTAPVNKAAIIRAGHSGFTGQTEHLSALAGTDRTVMMLLGADDRGRWLRVALATTHVAIKEVSLQLTADKVRLAVERAVGACRDLGLPRGRVGVCGLNPHAGESGEIGREEVEVIEPVVRRLQAEGLTVAGPLAADTLFHQAYRGDFDAVVAMYHDQGLAPLKMVCFDTGVNWTLGLPFIRTSPDHGTAYDIAGRGIAEPSSMVSAIRLVVRLASGRV